MTPAAISDHEFAQFQRFIFDAAGITMAPSKKALVSGRLSKRLQHHRVSSYGEYFKLLASGQAPGETQFAVDLLTTNETYFFRENKHFDLLRNVAQEARASGQALRVWSAACSSGEEPYSIAMVLADVLEQQRWEITASDISSRVLHKARFGHYPMERTGNIPRSYLQRFCLKGMDQYAGTLLVQRPLRQRVQFMEVNLNAPLPQLGSFDVIFLRNVLIYFSAATKRQVVARVAQQLKPGGYLFIGHSESLNDINSDVAMLAPSIYRKP
ncbi:SAM-dependent methyltransferase [Massilia sp. Root351]|jgi:chemotaxis protein methyltransferase CheR|uniref:CheR family methyltransferase n=1 Tax=Massilia sp. Root351 TaxID=1736522 RepID=UPI00070C5CAE|nr:protein-glutamate O-methyltransferase CheR [Massilia sp. Root351]KQV78591.1 SAM-dependent methyltransferase [Massilia sp. Root351]